jgi:hypothetical protein
VVGGLLASTALTLFVVPVLYTLFNRDSADRERNGALEDTVIDMAPLGVR